MKKLPEINIDILNLLSRDNDRAYLLKELALLLRKFFFAKLENISIDVNRLERSVNPYIFYVGHSLAAIDLELSGIEEVSLDTLQSSKSESSYVINDLKLEHFALQLVGVLGELYFSNSNIVFRGKVEEEGFLKSECISFCLSYKLNEIVYSGNVNLFISSELELAKEALKLDNSPILVGDNFKGVDKFNVQVFLGILFLAPATLVDMFTLGFEYELPESISFEKCFLLIDSGKYFSGALKSQNSSPVFVYDAATSCTVETSRKGYSAVFIRLYSEEIDLERVTHSYPYLKFDSDFRGLVEMLVGGELVATGILEERKDGLFVKVC